MATQTYAPLQTITLSSTATEVTFASIPSSYRDLVFVFSGQGTATVQNTFLEVNGVSSGYSNYGFRGNGTAVGAYSGQSVAVSLIIANETLGQAQSIAITEIMDYSANDRFTRFRTRASNNNPAGKSVELNEAKWGYTSIVNSMRIFVSAGSFAIGSTFSLYGIEA